MSLQLSPPSLILPQHLWRHFVRFGLVAAGLFCVTGAFAQNGLSASEVEVGDLHYVVEQGTTLYRDADKQSPYLRLGFREPLIVSDTQGEMREVYTQDGAHGYVDGQRVSNVWILISKRQKSLRLFRGLELIIEFNADFGYND